MLSRLLAGLILAAASPLLAQGITAVDVTTLADGDYVLTKKAGVVTVRPLTLVTPGVPTPTPTPPAPTVLTDRAKAIQAEAIKVGDPATAKELAEVYRQVAKLAKDGGPVKDAATLQGMVKFATDTLLGPVKAPAWQKTRDVLSIQWARIPPGSPVGDFSTLLEEAASGLDAVDLKKSISPEMLKWIMEVLLPLLLKIFFPT